MSVFILKKISKSFGKNEVLKDIDLVLPDNGLVSIVGKSGCGKSTLLNILMGIERPSKGKCYFCGHDISKFNDRKFSKYHLSCVSLVFQHYNLFSKLTAFENAILPLKMKGEKFDKSSETVKEYFKQFNIEYLMNQKVSKLSGGERQRVAIIRTLVTNPKAILCDEPTGALDSQNSEEIMEILKKISKNRLVIMVSHNKRLVNRYSDVILSMKDGKIDENISSLKNTFTAQFSKPKITYKNKWVSKFLRLNLKTNFKKNIFSIISCSLSFAVMFVAVGFSFGSKKSQNEASNQNLSIGYSTISEIENIEIEGSPLLYQKTKRPQISKVDDLFKDFTSVRYEENISYFISGASKCTFNSQVFDNFSMIPVYDLTLANYGKELLVDGCQADGSFDEILVNEEFVKMLGINPLNQYINLSNFSQVSYSTGDEKMPFIKDAFSYNKNFKIVGILHEFPFLNTPKIYFSYKGAKSYLKSSLMENLSFYLGKKYSFFDYLENCKNDDPVSSYSSYIFLDNLSEIDEFLNICKNNSDSTIEITSSASEVKETYSMFIDSFSTTLFLFVGIAFIGINFILGMISLSTFIENKKETAIMTCLGSRNSSIYNLYLLENLLLIFVSFIFSIFGGILLQKILNPFLHKKFGLSELISIPFLEFFGVPFGLMLLVLSIAIIFSIVFTITPMVIYRRKSLGNELRDE